ncbi:MAG: lipopolysaccharide kinase InaA family protein [Planctomycetota bacterium]
MEMVKLSSAPLSTPVVKSSIGQSGSAPMMDAPSTHFDQGLFDGQQWTYRNGFDAFLRQVSTTVWRTPRSQGWQLVKHNARREVWRASLSGRIFYLKYYRSGSWLARLKHWLRGRACETEWNGGIFALRWGINAVSPAGFTTRLPCAGGYRDLLISEAAEPAYALNDFWRKIRADDDSARRRRDTGQVIERLAELIARAHQSGFEHLDMHAANILVQPIAPGRYRVLFVDLQSARLGVPISARAIVRNLAQLNQWFRRHSSIGERLRFLRAYFCWRHEYEGAFTHGRLLELSFGALIQALARVADRHARRLWARRDRRARRNGRYYARLKLAGGWRGMALARTKHGSEESRASHLILKPTWWRTELANPLRWFTTETGQSCKDSHSADVRRVILSHPDGNIPAIVKRPRARNWRRRLSQCLSVSRSLRGWRRGQALLHRNINTARPLVALERRRGPFVLDSILLTEAIPGAVDLETHLHKEHATRNGTEWFHHKRMLLELVVRQLRRLHARGFSHRDCKASNILVSRYPRIELLWIDMDGIRGPHRRPRQGQEPQALVCLHVSLLEVPGLTRTDRVRFLKSYCARFGADPNTWRRLWHELDPHIANKVAAKHARRAWKRAKYGRA